MKNVYFAAIAIVAAIASLVVLSMPITSFFGRTIAQQDDSKKMWYFFSLVIMLMASAIYSRSKKQSVKK